jgi:hypothetical protein
VREVGEMGGLGVGGLGDVDGKSSFQPLQLAVFTSLLFFHKSRLCRKFRGLLVAHKPPPVQGS